MSVSNEASSGAGEFPLYPPNSGGIVTANDDLERELRSVSAESPMRRLGQVVLHWHQSWAREAFWTAYAQDSCVGYHTRG